MKTAKVNIPFLPFIKAEMICPYCNNTTQQDREFKSRNGGMELSCKKCQKTFKVPGSPSPGTISVSPRVEETGKGFWGLQGQVTKLRCPYCWQDSEREKGFKDTYAGKPMRCDHCQDIFSIPAKPVPAPVIQKPVYRQPVYQQPVATPPPAPKQWVTCPQCSGQGRRSELAPGDCDQCSGKGKVSDMKYVDDNGYVQSNYFTCNACQGSGRRSTYQTVTCRNCAGQGGWYQ